MDPAPADAAPVYAPEIPPEQGSGAPVGGQRPMLAEQPGSGGVPHHAAHLPDPVLNEDDGKSGDEVLPSISEINLTGAQALPELHLDVHVYATKPADRFVYINMRKYREGADARGGAARSSASGATVSCSIITVCDSCCRASNSGLIVYDGS